MLSPFFTRLTIFTEYKATWNVIWHLDMSIIGRVSVTRSRELLFTDAKTLSTGWKRASWVESIYERLLEPWWLIATVTVSTSEGNLPFKKPFACCQRQHSLPKAFCSKRRRDIKPFFSFLINTTESEKLNTWKRLWTQKLCTGIFYIRRENIRRQRISHMNKYYTITLIIYPM